MLQVKEALQQTTSHGLPRLVTTKPWFVRIIWLLFFLAFLGLCLKGVIDFVRKLQSRQVTTTLEANALAFKFPDVYACMENPASTSYAATMDNRTVTQLAQDLDRASNRLSEILLAGIGSPSALENLNIEYSFALQHSLKYTTLIDGLAHRLEQAVLTSDFTYTSSNGLPSYDVVPASEFYHPDFLRCIRWVLNDTVRATLAKGGTSSGLIVTLLTDANFSSTSPTGPPILSKVFAGGSLIPVSDWSLSRLDFDDPDRKAGVRIYLCPPGEYPTAFVTSFSLGPGRFHTVDIGMSERVYNSASFDCLSDPLEGVQFVNPYSQEPYNHSYSHSYCYFKEYHRLYQKLTNLSGDASPLPYPMRGRRYLFNLTGEDGNFLQLTNDLPADPSLDLTAISNIVENTREACKQKAPCSTLEYDVTMSSTDWPTYSSVVPFVSATVMQAKLAAGNLSVPAIDRLLNAGAATAAAIANANLLKMSFRIRTPSCSRLTYSIDYGLNNFISDIGGILGVYLGMSLLTFCELLELAYDLGAVLWEKRAASVKPGSQDNDNEIVVDGVHAVRGFGDLEKQLRELTTIGTESTTSVDSTAKIVQCAEL